MKYELSKTEIAKANRTIVAMRLIEIANYDLSVNPVLRREILELAEKIKKNN